jgi:hypothetical protein
MPTYDYRCRACRAEFSLKERIADHAMHGTASGVGSDRPAAASGPSCPRCRSDEVERVIGAAYPRTPRKS